ncbi:hypothetical protein chiPu_0013081 [Chiloscyllium punctatum]|uniref:Uncharacterized protein n=1 Tax=Chiloscyllium punctatum TaxID=137246 RepID=A0A401SW72_CHIPU|nr:hypothetical protein [Chiloscyllium punctatum]
MFETQGIIPLVFTENLGAHVNGADSYLLEPDENTDEQSSLPAVYEFKFQRVSHNKVAINGNEAEEANTDVNILVEEQTAEDAKFPRMLPVIVLQHVLNPQR